MSGGFFKGVKYSQCYLLQEIFELFREEIKKYQPVL